MMRHPVHSHGITRWVDDQPRPRAAAPVPYTATPAEALLDTGLVLTVLGGCAALAPRWAGLLAVPGAMTLSVYVAHLWYLGWVRRLGPGPWRSATGADDTWFNLAVLVVGALLLPLLWRAVVRIGPFRAGPLEGVVRPPPCPAGRRRRRPRPRPGRLRLGRPVR